MRMQRCDAQVICKVQLAATRAAVKGGQEDAAITETARLGDGWRCWCDPGKGWLSSQWVMTRLYLNTKHQKIKIGVWWLRSRERFLKHWWEQKHQERKYIFRKINYVGKKVVYLYCYKTASRFSFLLANSIPIRKHRGISVLHAEFHLLPLLSGKWHPYRPLWTCVCFLVGTKSEAYSF